MQQKVSLRCTWTVDGISRSLLTQYACFIMSHSCIVVPPTYIHIYLHIPKPICITYYKNKEYKYIYKKYLALFQQLRVGALLSPHIKWVWYNHNNNNHNNHNNSNNNAAQYQNTLHTERILCEKAAKNSQIKYTILSRC